MDAYLGARLFAPLGITPGAWHRDEAGHPHAMAGLPLTARHAARLGQLLIDRGRLADGTVLLPEAFVGRSCSRPSARSARVGLLWWRVPEWEQVVAAPSTPRRAWPSAGRGPGHWPPRSGRSPAAAFGGVL